MSWANLARGDGPNDGRHLVPLAVTHNVVQLDVVYHHGRVAQSVSVKVPDESFHFPGSHHGGHLHLARSAGGQLDRVALRIRRGRRDVLQRAQSVVTRPALVTRVRVRDRGHASQGAQRGAAALEGESPYLGERKRFARSRLTRGFLSVEARGEEPCSGTTLGLYRPSPIWKCAGTEVPCLIFCRQDR